MVAAAIAHRHKDAGFHVPVHHGVARIVLEELGRDDVPGPGRAISLDVDCYLDIRKTAHQSRWGVGSRMERTASARRQGAVDVAMISFMQDARLRVSEAPALVWGVSSVCAAGQAACVAGKLGRTTSAW